MKRIILGMVLTVSVALSQELSQYEALQKLNKASGKIATKTINNTEGIRILKREINLLKAQKNLIKAQEKQIENLTSQVELLEKRLSDIESHLQIKNKHLADEVILKIKKELSHSLVGKNEMKVEKSSTEVQEFVVNTWALNARKGNSIDFGIVGRYKIGSIVKVQDVDEQWVKVKGTNKHLSKDYLVEKEELEIITTNNTIIRSFPSFEKKYIKNKIEKNIKLRAVAKLLNTQWYLLENGTFINKRYIKEI